MATKKSYIDIELTLSNLQQFRTDINSSIDEAKQLQKEFKGVGTSVDHLEKVGSTINKAIAIISTKVDKDGKMSVGTAKELQDVLAKLQEQILQLQSSEQGRFDNTKFLEKFKIANEELTKELEKQAKLEKDLVKQQKQLEKTQSISTFANTAKTSDDAKEVISRVDNKVLRDLVTPTGKGGSYTKAGREKLVESGITEETAQEIYKLYSLMDEKAAVLKERISQIKKEIETINRSVREKKGNLNEILKTGTKTDTSSSKLGDEIERLSPKLQNLIADAKENNNEFINFNKTVGGTEGAFNAATKAIINSRIILQMFKRVLGEAIRTVKELDAALTGMTAVTGMSREEARKYIPVLNDLAQATSSTMTDVANLTTEYLRQGRTMSEALTLTEETAKAAKIAGISVSDSLTYMTAAINGFNLAATEAQNVSDIFANVAAKTATNYEQLAVALSKVSAQANLAGLSIEYTTALLAKGIETTQEAPESIGTALKTIIARMREITDYNKVLEDGTSINKVEKNLAAAGISLRDATGAFKDLEQIFNELGPKWDTLNEMQRQSIAQAVAGTRQQSRFVAIMQDWNRTLEIVSEAEESAGAAAFQYSKTAEGLAANITNLTTSWQNFTTSLVDTEFINTILKNITEVLNIFSKMPAIFKTLLVLGGSAAALSKIRKVYMDYQYNKLVQTLKIQLDAGEITEEEFKQRLKSKQTLAQELAYERAKLAVMREQLGVKKASISNVAAGITGGKNGGSEEKYNNLTEEQNELLKQQEEIVSNLEAKNKSVLSSKLQILGTSLKILGTSTSNLSNEQAGFLIQNKNIVTQLKLLLLNKNKLLNETAISAEMKEQLLVQKAMAKLQLAQVGAIAGALALIALVVVAVKQVVKLFKTEEEALENINKSMSEVYSLKDKKKTIKELTDEYAKLNNTINKTAEDEERMAAIEEQLNTDYGLIGTGNNLVTQAVDKQLEISHQITAEQNKMIADTLEAFEKSANKTDFFKNSTFENAFKQKYTMQLNTNLEEEMSKAVAQGIITMEEYNAKLGESKKIASNVMSNVNSADIARQAIAQQKANETFWTGTPGEIIGTNVALSGGALGGAAIGAAAGAAIGSVVPIIGNVIGTGIGAAIGALAGGIAAVTATVKANSKKNAEEAALEQAKIMGQVTEETARYSKEVALAEDQSLENRYAILKKYLNDSNIESATKNALSKTEASLIAIFENPELSKTISSIRKKLNNATEKLGDKLVNAILDLTADFGDNVTTEASRIIDESLSRTGGDVAQAYADLYKAMSDSNSGIYKLMEQDYIDNYQGQIDAIDYKLNEWSKNRQKEDAERLGVSLDAWKQNLTEERGKLEAQMRGFSTSEEYLSAKNKSLTSISGYATVLELSQGLVAAKNVSKSISDNLDKLNDGSITLEEFLSLSNELGDSFYDSLDMMGQGLENIDASLVNTLVTPYEEYSKTFDDMITQLQTQIDTLDPAENAETIKNLTNQLKAVKAYQENTLKFSEQSLKTVIRTYQYKRYEKEIEEGNLENAEKLVELRKEEVQESQNKIDKLFTGYEEEKDLIKQIRAGAISFEDAWEKVGNKDYFKTMYETAEEYFDNLEEKTEELGDTLKLVSDAVNSRFETQIDQQNKLLDLYKSRLEKEQESLQNSLDKRKSMYEKYFDALEGTEDTATFEEEQRRLQNAISNLVGATDATSLSKLKSYQEELAQLEKDRISTERENRKEAVLENLDNESEAIDQYYEERLANEQLLWQEITSMGESGIMNLMTIYNEEFKSATDLNKAYMLLSYKELHRDIMQMLGNTSGYNSANTDYENYQKWMQRYMTNPAIGPYDSTKKYLQGGLVDYTGYAMVHGSSSKPEAFLNASQTQMFSRLASELGGYYSTSISSNGLTSDNAASNITIEKLSIELDATLTNNNVQETGQNLAQALIDGLTRTGLTVNMKR